MEDPPTYLNGIVTQLLDRYNDLIMKFADCPDELLNEDPDTQSEALKELNLICMPQIGKILQDLTFTKNKNS